MQKVLIIDDEPAIRAMMSRLLSEHGVRVTVAADGADALERLAEEPFDLILLDLMMPRLDGFGFIQKLQAANGCHPPILVASAGSPEMIRRLAPGSVSGVIGKPFDVVDLLRRVDQLLGATAVTASCCRGPARVGPGAH